MPKPSFPKSLPVVLAALSALAATAASRADTASDLLTVRARRLEQIKTAPPPEDVVVAQANLQDDGSFKDLDYASTLVNDGWQPRIHLDRLTAFTRAYLNAGPDHGSPKLRAQVVRGIEWWLQHDYQSKNWFWNQIGVPNRLTPSLLVFWDSLSKDQKDKCTAILNRAKIEGSGANLVWLSMIVADRGLLLNDATQVKKAFAAIANDVHLAPKQQDGAQPDNSYLYHGPLLYSWGYGISYLRDEADLMALVAGTGFAFPKEKAALVRDWTLDGAQWMTRGWAVDCAGLGRGIARKGWTSQTLVGTGTDLRAVNAGRDQELADMVARAKGDPKAPPLVGNRTFWRADLMTHHRPGWYASARLYSARTKNTEWGNGEALRSFYLADGINLLMRTGREYYDIYPVWDWQRVPGTTVEMIPNFGPIAGKPDGDPLGFVPSRNGIVKGTKETFVGGVSDGQYGVFGGRFTRDAFSVRRGWFFFDDQYVCLQAGLTCNTDNPVITTLDQCHSAGPITASTGDASDAKDKPKTLDGVRWLLHDGVGYVFADPARVTMKAGPQTGSWHDISLAYPPEPETQDVFWASIEHGAKPQNAAVAYTVFPQTDAKALAEAAAGPPATVVSNTADCQAVWHAGLGRGGAILYAAGKVQLHSGLTVTLDRPAMLLAAEKDGALTLTLSNPENKPATVHATVESAGKTAAVEFKLPDGGKAGSSVSQAARF